MLVKDVFVFVINVFVLVKDNYVSVKGIYVFVIKVYVYVIKIDVFAGIRAGLVMGEFVSVMSDGVFVIVYSPS